jgi:hypothetical protein
LSLKTNSKDSYLIASNYRNLGNMYFRNAAYPAAAKYYDSTLLRLTTNRESNKIQKIRNNLDEVILYEALAKRNDSILNVVAMNDSERLPFEKYIVKLKAADEIKRVLEEKQNKTRKHRKNSSISSIDPASNQQPENLPK